MESGVQDAASDVTIQPADHPDPPQPARVLTSASARTVPAGCGSDDQDAVQSAWFRGDMQGRLAGVGIVEDRMCL